MANGRANRRSLMALLLLASAGIAPEAQAAGDRALGEYLAAECSSCHQASGRQQGGIPAIVGWPDDQFIALMGAYKDKQRESQVMQTIAARLSQDEVAALASYYGSLKPSP